MGITLEINSKGHFSVVRLEQVKPILNVIWQETTIDLVPSMASIITNWTKE